MNNQDLNHWNYALFSAHIYQYLPEIAWADHPAFYEKWQTYHQPRTLMTAQPFVMPAEMDRVLAQPSLLCLYHLGLHGQFPIKLAEAGLHFDILLDRQVYETQRSYFVEMKAQLDTPEREYRFLMSDDPAVLLKIRTAIREGKHMVVFADGNSGAQTAAAQKIEIDFFNDKLRVRQGIGLISYLLRISIVPVTHQETYDGISVKLGDLIKLNPLEPRFDYIKRSTQLLYQFLETELKMMPWKWECWQYLHQMDAFTKMNDTDVDFHRNEDHIAVLKLKLNNRMGNFDRKNYFFYY